MKNKLSLISSIIQLVFGLFAVIAFIIISINGEFEARWTVSLILAVAFIIIGIIGIIDFKNNK